MSVHDNENMLDSTENDQIDQLLAEDRRRMIRIASERIESGMYARITRCNLERNTRARRWQWGLAVAALALTALAAVWFRAPAQNNSFPAASRSTRPLLSQPDSAHLIAKPSAKRAPPARLGHSSPSQSTPAHALVPRRPTFPINVAATEQEILLSRLASESPKELQAMAEAMAAERIQEETERQQFDQWLQQRGEKQ